MVRLIWPFWRRWRAMSLRRYPRAACACSTRAAVPRATEAAPFMTRETVITLTPAAAATSRMVGRSTASTSVRERYQTVRCCQSATPVDKTRLGRGTTLSRSGNDRRNYCPVDDHHPAWSGLMRTPSGNLVDGTRALDSAWVPSQNPADSL